MEKLGSKIRIAERSGMRRFLYPVRVKLPTLYRRSISSLALAEADGTLVPSLVETTDSGDVSCLLALSLAPHESRELSLVRIEPSDNPAAVPDPLFIAEDEDGYVSRQERVAFEIGSLAQLGSVLYDGQQHLAGPLSITLNGHVVEPTAGDYRPTLSDTLNGGLGARFTFDGVYAGEAEVQPTGATELELTCCKSWVWAAHTLQNAPAGALLRFTLPLTVTSPVQTCDFGAGNGAYGKIQPGTIDEIVWEIDLSDTRAPRYAIQSLITATGEARVDYAGEVKAADLASRLWLHWTEPTKSLALAVTDYPKSCRSLALRLSDRGVVAVEFELGESTDASSKFAICCHFLNDLPAIAAATNPASILLPPAATVTRVEI